MRRASSVFTVIAAAMLVVAPRVMAHDGHGDPRLHDSVWHYLFEPVHLPLVLAVLALLVFATRRVSRRRCRETGLGTIAGRRGGASTGMTRDR